MGLSANQARLLTLTARVHDLQLQSMTLSAQKLDLSMRGYTLAVNYSNALSDKTAYYNSLIDDAGNEINNGGGSSGYYITTWTKQHHVDKLEFNFSNLTAYGYTLTDKRPRPQGASGSGLGTVNAQNVPVPKTQAEMIKYLKEYGLISGDPQVSGNDVYYTTPTGMELDEGYTSAAAGGKISMNEVAKYFCLGRDTSDAAFQYNLDRGVWGEFVSYTHNNCQPQDPSDTLTPMSQLSPSELRSEIVAGRIELKDNKGNVYTGNNVPTEIVYEWDEDVPVETWIPGDDGGSNPYGGNYNGGGSSKVDDLKDEKRDELDKLEREYEKAMKKLTMQEKVIDMQMTQNNTELQACNTEMDSVKSLLEKNVERDFTLFG